MSYVCNDFTVTQKILETKLISSPPPPSPPPPPLPVLVPKYKKTAKPPSKYLLESEKGLSQEINSIKMASVAVGINCMGPLGGNQGLWPYPSGPSQLSIPLSLGHIFNLMCLRHSF